MPRKKAPADTENLMSLADRDLRLECLRLALKNVTGSHETVVRDAGAFFDFVTGKDRADAGDVAAELPETFLPDLITKVRDAMRRCQSPS